MIKQSREIKADDSVLQRLAFSPDGQMIAVCGRHLVQLFDVKTGERRRSFAGHTDIVTCIAWSPDGRLLASGSEDRTIRLWTVDSGELVRVVQEEFKWYSGKILSMLTHLVFYPDGKTLASSEGSAFVRLWDVETGHWKQRLSIRHLKACNHMDISRDGKSFAIAGTPNVAGEVAQVSLYQVDFGLCRKHFLAHHGTTSATGVSFSHDGRRIVTCGQDNTSRIWNVESGAQLHKLNGPSKSKGVVAAAFIPNGTRVVSMTGEETIQVWNADDSKLISTVDGTDGGARGFALSPDGRTLATCGEEQVIKLWDNLSAATTTSTKPKTKTPDQR